MGTGTLSAELAHRFAAGGYVGRHRAGISMRGKRPAIRHMTRCHSQSRFFPKAMSTPASGFAFARSNRASICSIKFSTICPPVRFAHRLAGRAGEGFALVEGFRGDIFCWIRLDAAGRVGHCRLRDPSWFQWPLLEAVIEGNIVADFPLCNKSFNCSYSGHDL